MAKQIKGTLELAMEMMAKIPRLSEEEKREQEENECRPRGEALAKKYLADEIAESLLQTELLREQGRRGEIVRRAFLSVMCGSLSVENETTTSKAWDGIKVLCARENLGTYRDQFSDLIKAYEERRASAFADVQKQEHSRLRVLGISGSAIRLDLKDSRAWQKRQSVLVNEFAPETEGLRHTLLDALLASLMQRMAL